MTQRSDDLDRAMTRLRVAIDAAGGSEMAARMVFRADAAGQLCTALKSILPYAEDVPADILHLCRAALASAAGQQAPPHPGTVRRPDTLDLSPVGGDAA